MFVKSKLHELGRRLRAGRAVLFLIMGLCVASKTPALEIMTWIPAYAIPACKTTLQATWGDTCAPRFTITLLAIQWYNGDMNGNISSGVAAADLTWVKSFCATNKIKLLMCITDFGASSWDWNVAVACFKTNQNAFINNIMNLVNQNGFDGVDIDFEGSGNDNQSDYATFIKLLAAKLHATGKVLSLDCFPYIWNNPNVNWWKDWVGSIDFINPMQYQGGENDPNIYYKWSWRQDQGTNIGYKASQIMLSFPGWMDTWSGGSMGTDLLSYIKESQTAPKAPGPISVWDCQFQAAGWRTAAAWQALHKVKLTNNISTEIARQNTMPAFKETRMSARLIGETIRLTTGSAGAVDVKLFDARGRFVRIVYSGNLSQGVFCVPFPAKTLSQGTYVVSMNSPLGQNNSIITVP